MKTRVVPIAGTCTLSQAWPPFSGQTDAELRTYDAAKKRVHDLYRHCNVHDGYDLELGVHDSYVDMTWLFPTLEKK